MPNINTRGGSRPGSGRKAGKPTKTISFRIDPAHEQQIKKVVRKEINRLKSGGK